MMIELTAVVFWPVFRFLDSDLHWQNIRWANVQWSSRNPDTDEYDSWVETPTSDQQQLVIR